MVSYVHCMCFCKIIIIIIMICLHSLWVIEKTNVQCTCKCSQLASLLLAKGCSAFLKISNHNRVAKAIKENKNAVKLYFMQCGSLSHETEKQRGTLWVSLTIENCWLATEANESFNKTTCYLGWISALYKVRLVIGLCTLICSSAMLIQV